MTQKPLSTKILARDKPSPFSRRRGPRAARPGSGSAAEAPIPIWLTLAGVAGGVAFAMVAAESDTAIETVALLAGAAASGGLGLYGLFERLSAARAALGRTPASAFLDIYDAAPEPTALVDATGRVRAVNAAARAAGLASVTQVRDATPWPARGVEFGSGGEGAAGPEHGAGDAAARGLDQTVFDVLRAARSGRAARWVGAAPPGLSIGAGAVEVLVWPSADGGAIWRWTAVSGLGGGGGDWTASADVGVLHIRADGRVARVNGVFERWLDGAGARGPERDRRLFELLPDVARAAAEQPGERRFFAETRLSAPAEGAPRLVSLLYAPTQANGEAVCVAAPLAAGRALDGAMEDDPEGLLGALDALTASRLFRDAPIGVLALSLDGRILRLNEAAHRLLSGEEAGPHGVAWGPLGDRLIDWIGEEDREEASAQLRAALPDPAGLGPAFEARLGHEPNAGRIAQFFFSRIESDRGPLLLCYMIDSSEQRVLEERFIRAQKLQAAGQLAAGIAHDFNNILGVILVASESLLEAVNVGDPDYQELSLIQQNAQRAANLVEQLKAYSRKQTLSPTQVNLTEMLSELAYMLSRITGSRSELLRDLAEGLWPAKVDVNKFEQVVTNLVVNARDAIDEKWADADAAPGGRDGAVGRIVLRTYNETLLSARRGANFAMPPGDYVCVEVADNGPGVPREIREKIFEPFFTTKPVGKGTGLGLSTVFGIVKQSGGYLFVDTEIGVGTTFQIFLPRHRPSKPREREAVDRETQGTGARRGSAAVETRAGAASSPGSAASPSSSATPAPSTPAPSAAPTAAARKAAQANALAAALARRGVKDGLEDGLEDGAGAAARPDAGPSSTSAPSTSDPSVAPQRRPSAASPAGAAILVVDDETSLRQMAAKSLRARGFTVLEAESGEDALEILEDESVEIDLLLSDVIMPGIDGPELLRALGDRRPALRTIFMSGHTRDAFADTLDAALAEQRRFDFISKPFRLDALTKAIAEALDRG